MPVHTLRLLVLCISSVMALSCQLCAAESSWFDLTLRSRIGGSDSDLESRPVERSEKWKPSETAVIVCDMWDSHHCLNAVRRVGELVPRMNDVLTKARDSGALIIHAPSSCMDAYANHPARKRAQNAPSAANSPQDIGRWCTWKNDLEEETGYPIDHTDGGEDDDPDEHSQWYIKLTEMGRNPYSPWVKQVDGLDIDPERDAISDQGGEVWNLLEDRGIQNVVLVGVHTNMCVLGRPFGLRQMANNGKNVVLMRDMTDTMYNPMRAPYVSHFRGTDLVVEHIEKMVCPSITSDQILGGSPFTFQGDRRPHIVIAISEPEYLTEETLPRFAQQIWSHKHGYHVTVLLGDPSTHRIPGFASALNTADAVVISIRRQALPAQDIEALRAHLESGKPLIGIRTANHALNARGKGPKGHVEWKEFDQEVLGGNYHGHHANELVSNVRVIDGASHPVLFGVDLSSTSEGSLYKVSPLANSATPLLIGEVPGHPAEPVAWVNTCGPNDARVFYTSLGHKTDFEKAVLPVLLENALKWALDRPIPLTLDDLRRDWHKVCVPRPWQRVIRSSALASYDGFAWYGCQVKVPSDWKGKELTLSVGKIGDSDETFLNGQKIGATGRLSAAAADSKRDQQRTYKVPARAFKPDAWNTLSVRTLNTRGDGGIHGGELSLSDGQSEISLQGTWLIRVGDQQEWANELGQEAKLANTRFQ